MPRKSKERRLSETQALFAAYEEAGIAGDYHGRFLRDMKRRLEAGKGLYPKQRNWLDSLIEQGVPEPKGDLELIAKIDAARDFWAGVPHRGWELGVILDMRRVVANDWKMSSKQTKLLNDLLQRHQDDVTGANVYTPTAEQRADLEALVSLHRGYSGQWISERPAVRKAVERVVNFLNGSGTIEEYHYTKLMKAMGSRLRQLKSPRFTAGNLGWKSIGWGESREVLLVTAITDVYVSDRGQIVNDWMLPSGSVETWVASQVSKRRLR